MDHFRHTWLFLDPPRHKWNRTGFSVETSDTGRFSAFLPDQDNFTRRAYFYLLNFSSSYIVWPTRLIMKTILCGCVCLMRSNWDMPFKKKKAKKLPRGKICVVSRLTVGYMRWEVWYSRQGSQSADIFMLYPCCKSKSRKEIHARTVNATLEQRRVLTIDPSLSRSNRFCRNTPQPMRCNRVCVCASKQWPPIIAHTYSSNTYCHEDLCYCDFLIEISICLLLVLLVYDDVVNVHVTHTATQTSTNSPLFPFFSSSSCNCYSCNAQLFAVLMVISIDRSTVLLMFAPST